jgi:hypothetical protein
MGRRKVHALIARSVGVTIALGAAQQVARATITFGQIDDFQGGTTMNWSEGPVTPNPPTNISNGGPNGTGDKFLQNVSSGVGTAGSKQVMFNQMQWTGDYNSAGVTQISGFMANFGTTTLNMRYGVQGGAGTQYVSSIAQTIPPDAQWHAVTFVLSSATMTNVNFGLDPLADVLASVTEVRILSSGAGGAWQGDSIAATLGVDNLRAMTLAGDANHDRSVDTVDFNLLAANFSGAGKEWGDGDFNFDTIVDTVDFNLLAANFSASVPSADPGSLVPEPQSAIALLTVAASCLVRRQFRR